MIVFCPNCGTQNAGLAGARATCSACASTFDVPADAGRPAQAPAAPPPPSFSAPGAQVFSAPAAPLRVTPSANGTTNLLAIVSLVAGFVCCVPLSFALAIATGFMSLKQIDASGGAQKGRGLAIVGITFGAVSAILQALFLIGTLSNR